MPARPDWYRRESDIHPVGSIIIRLPGVANLAFGGDGFHLVALTGPGQVWLQSMPLPILAHALDPYLARQTDTQAAGAGAVGGILGDIIRGQ